MGGGRGPREDAEEPPVRIKIFFTGAKKNTELGTLIFNLMVSLHYTSLASRSIEVTHDDTR